MCLSVVPLCFLWAWRDSNPQGSLHALLRRTRIPVPPHALSFAWTLHFITLSLNNLFFRLFCSIEQKRRKFALKHIGLPYVLPCIFLHCAGGETRSQIFYLPSLVKFLDPSSSIFCAQKIWFCFSRLPRKPSSWLALQHNLKIPQLSGGFLNCAGGETRTPKPCGTSS